MVSVLYKAFQIIHHFFYSIFLKQKMYGHVRYQLALKLIDSGKPNDLLQAFVWLGLAAEDKSVHIKASNMKYKLSQQLKSQNLLDKAIALENNYRTKYSNEFFK